MSEESLQHTHTLTLANERMIFALFGPQDTFRRLLERRLKIKLYAKHERITLYGGQLAVDRGYSVLSNLIDTLNRGQMLFLHDVERVINLYESEDAPDFILDCSQSEEGELTVDSLNLKEGEPASPPRNLPTFTTYDQRQIQPKTPNQTRYVELISDHDITFGVGPAGTGKIKLHLQKVCPEHRSRTTRLFFPCVASSNSVASTRSRPRRLSPQPRTELLSSSQYDFK